MAIPLLYLKVKDKLAGVAEKTELVIWENAEQLNNVLPDDIKPTVIVMNPPFSATGGRMQGQRKTMNGAQHIEQALQRLEPVSYTTLTLPTIYSV